MEPILRVRNLVKHFKVSGSRTDVVHAVDDISFDLYKGETIGIVGESGSGKSTLAKTIIRLHDPTSGEVYLGDKLISNMKEKDFRPLRRRMQMIFQDPYSSLNGRMVVQDIIAEPLIAHGITKDKKEMQKKVYDILEQVGLSSDHAHRYPHEFSGGQRQRIGIARALIIKPEIVICDEAVSALDVSVQAQIVNLLKQFQERDNLTYIFIAHDLSMVQYVSDRVCVMYLGKVVEFCGSERIYEAPLHPYTKGLLAAIPVPDPGHKHKVESGATITGNIPSPISPPSGCRFHTRCPQKMDVCSTEEPPLIEVEKNHFVACHLCKEKNEN